MIKDDSIYVHLHTSAVRLLAGSNKTPTSTHLFNNFDFFLH